MSTYVPTIGLEIHAELKTATKMFCYSKNDPDEKHPNTNICPICMGHPGTLPVINREAVNKVLAVGASINGTLAEFSQFDRKNYFYPDLPKGYQISQYKFPLVEKGYLDITLSVKNEPSESRTKKTESKRIRIQRIHLEEDTGRLIHDPETNSSLIDFNRAGVALMELVTEPDFHSGEEVIAFGEELQRILRYTDASHADMEKGQMRVEVNISLAKEDKPLGTKVEIKNINSFKYAADAVAYEIKRQGAILDAGENIMQETRGWNEHSQKTISQRSKEEANDYRYFPEPDLPPLRFTPEYLDIIKSEVPELPAAKRIRFAQEYGIPTDMVDIMVRDKAFAGYVEAVMSELLQHEKEEGRTTPGKNAHHVASSLLTGDFMRFMKDLSADIADVRLTPENFAELSLYLSEDKISNLTAKDVLLELMRDGGDPSDLIEKKGLWQMSDTSDLEDVAAHIIKENPEPAVSYRGGKESSLQFLVGQVMKETRGKANPKMVQEVLKKQLAKDI